MSADNIHQLFQPDENAIRAHLVRLFRRVPAEYPGGWMEIAWAEPTGAVKFAEWFSCTPEGIERAVASAAARNREHRNVYVGVNPRRPDAMPGGRASTEDVDLAFFQFAECDKLESIELLRKATIPYSFAVTTGKTPHRRPHAYWEVEDPIRNMQAWSAQQAGLRDYFKGDAVLDPPRIMRLAGTINYPAAHKEQRGYRVELVTIRTIYDNEERAPTTSAALASVYSLSGARSYDRETGEVFEESDAQGSAEGATGPHFDSGGLSIKELIDSIQRGREWHNNTLRLVAHMVNRGDPDALILALAPALTLADHTVEKTHRQISGMLISARTKWHIPNRDYEDFSAEIDNESLFETLDFDELSLLPPVTWLVDKLITDHGLSIIYGDPATGKTFLALDMVLHLIYGMPWHTRASRKTGILYIAGEGVRGLGKRIAAWRHHYGVSSQSAPMRIMRTAANLLDQKEVSKLLRTIDHITPLMECPVGLVIVDTVARSMIGDENETKDMTLFVNSCSLIQRHIDAAVLGIHHSGKDRDRGARGSTALIGAVDTNIEVTRDGNRIKVSVKKQKDDEELEPFYMSMVTVEVPGNGLNVETSMILEPVEEVDEPIGTERLNNDQITLVFDEVQRGWNVGKPWSNAPQTHIDGRYLPRWMCMHLGIRQTPAVKYVSDWITNGCLEIDVSYGKMKLRGLRVAWRPT